MKNKNLTKIFLKSIKTKKKSKKMFDNKRESGEIIIEWTKWAKFFLLILKYFPFQSIKKVYSIMYRVVRFFYRFCISIAGKLVFFFV